MKPELTPRELQLVLLVFKGKNSKQIAEYLNVSDKTIYKYKKVIYKKLNCCDVLSLAKRCIKLNIILIEEFLKD